MAFSYEEKLQQKHIQQNYGTYSREKSFSLFILFMNVIKKDLYGFDFPFNRHLNASFVLGTVYTRTTDTHPTPQTFAL